MTEGLKALNYLMKIQKNLEEDGATGEFSISKLRLCLNTIEKELKAFKIIKEKNVNILALKEVEDYERYLRTPAPSNIVDSRGVYHEEQVLTKEEFDLIKEELG